MAPFMAPSAKRHTNHNYYCTHFNRDGLFPSVGDSGHSLECSGCPLARRQQRRWYLLFFFASFALGSLGLRALPNAEHSTRENNSYTTETTTSASSINTVTTAAAELESALAFDAVRIPVAKQPLRANTTRILGSLDRWLEHQESAMVQNLPMLPHPQPYLLLPLMDDDNNPKLDHLWQESRQGKQLGPRWRKFFHVERMETGSKNNHTTTTTHQKMAWESEEGASTAPSVDYTNPALYSYPQLLEEPPTPLKGDTNNSNTYPVLEPLENLLQNWPQDDDDGATTTTTIHERLLHFNFSDPDELRMAQRFREAELPFKLYDIPDIDAATTKWTDAYLSRMFDADRRCAAGDPTANNRMCRPLDSVTTQESRTNFFAYYKVPKWRLLSLGLPPQRYNDWDYATFTRHAVYADRVRLQANYPHYYFKADDLWVPSDHHHSNPQPSFISRDLPLFAPDEPNFVVFSPATKKGVVCRFGERGVVAAAHFDAIRNMVAMISGAKRYLLWPPSECPRLGIDGRTSSSVYRHSLLNLGHLADRHHSSNNNNMSDLERAWLDRAATSQAVETVLKAGEILYIPSHWFHYVVSLQKSAQCNVAMGMAEKAPNPHFGGRHEVEQCLLDHYR